jgi:hypothetical protein
MPRSMRSNPRIGRLNETSLPSQGKRSYSSRQAYKLIFRAVKYCFSPLFLGSYRFAPGKIRHDRGSMRPVGFSRTGD